MNEERITYDEFMIMLKFAPKMCYTLYDKAEDEIDRLNNIINELEKYIHNELILDFYNDDMPCELIINKMEKMIKELKENNK